MRPQQISPEEDRPGLSDLGVAENSGPGASSEETVAIVRENAPER